MSDIASSDVSRAAKPLPLNGVVPLILHRIVRGAPKEWEDVHVGRLRNIVGHVSTRWAVFRAGGVAERARWMLTFDDGHSSDYEIVFPLLCEYGVSATFFLITDRVGEPGYLTWPQIEEMQRHGMCFGSHGRSHRRLTGLSKSEAKNEFVESKRSMEERLGTHVEAFSYPYGECSPTLHELGFAAGYRHLCTSAHGVVGAEERVIPRNSIHSGMGWERIEEVMSVRVATRLRWYLEDLAKGTIKKVIGHERYIHWRDREGYSQ